MASLRRGAKESLRIEERIRIPRLEVSIRKDGLLPRYRYAGCSLVDVNRGGIGFLSRRVKLAPLQRIRMRFSYRDQVFEARGLVGYRQTLGEEARYGVVFTHVPSELDRLIDRFVA